MFAAWWLEQTGEVINELPDPVTVKVPKPPAPAKATKPAEPELEQMQLSLFQMA
jgi:hypothetical protein